MTTPPFDEEEQRLAAAQAVVQLPLVPLIGCACCRDCTHPITGAHDIGGPRSGPILVADTFGPCESCGESYELHGPHDDHDSYVPGCSGCERQYGGES